MQTVDVQSADSTKSHIFAQDGAAYPNQGTLDTSDERYREYFDGLPPLV